MSEKYITVENLKRFLKNADKRYSSVKNNASQTTNGLMSKEDKIKLDNIEANANNYVLPTAGSTLGGVKTTSTVTSTSGLTACPIISGVPYYKDTNTTYRPFVKSGSSSASGLVPEPPKTQGDTRYLCEDGTWKEIDIDSAVHKTGNETIDGTKTFTSQIVGSIDKAEKDLNGNIITSTYATKSEIPTKVSDLTNDSGFARSADLSKVATSGSYNDLSNKPTIPTVNNATLTIQKNGTTVKTFTANSSSNVTCNITVPTKVSDLTNDSGFARSADLSKVATSGSYNDLSNKPTIPTVNNGTLTIQKNGTTVKTFTANSSTNVTCNITVPTKVSDLTNDSGFIADVSGKADKATTLSGYGITDAYTKTEVNTKISNLVNSAPKTLDTLNELANALGNDPNFATTVANQIGTKANDSDVVHKSGDETINGVKTFTSEIVNTKPNAFRHVYDNYAYFWHNDGEHLYLLLTNSGDPYGGWNNFRPLMINFATGICNINGNADTVDGSHAWQMQTLSAGGQSHGSVNWLMQCQHNVDGDNLFKLYVGDKSIGTKVDRANSAAYAERSMNNGAFYISGYQIYVG